MRSATHASPRHLPRAGLRALLIAFALLAVVASPVRGATPDPILLVHGYRGSASNFSELKPWLVDRGRTVVALSLPSQDNKVNV
jgi:triacylglycerol esterase/lipase EstA (alpha/beta hydrolase family)